MRTKEKSSDQIKFLIKIFDKTFHKQLPIEMEYLGTDLAVALYTKHRNYKPHYCINSLMESVVGADYKDIFMPSAYVLRLRAWDENEGIEIFPSVGPEKIGPYKIKMLRFFESGADLFDIDCLMFANISWKLYELEGDKSLKLVSSLAPMNASDIVSVVSNFIPSRA